MVKPFAEVGGSIQTLGRSMLDKKNNMDWSDLLQEQGELA